MLNRIVFTLGGLLLGIASPLLSSSLIAMAQGVSFNSYIWTLFHRNGFYNNYFQLGIAFNIGIFFLLMRKESFALIFFGRGWLVATILMVLWTVYIELNWSL